MNNGRVCRANIPAVECVVHYGNVVWWYGGKSGACWHNRLSCVCEAYIMAPSVALRLQNVAPP